MTTRYLVLFFLLSCPALAVCRACCSANATGGGTITNYYNVTNNTNYYNMTDPLNITEPGSEFYSTDPSAYPVVTVGGDRGHYEANFPIYFGLGVRPVVYVIADAPGESGFGGVAMPGAGAGGYGMCTGGAGQYGLAGVAYGGACVAVYADSCTLVGGCDDTYPAVQSVGPIALGGIEGGSALDAKICLGSTNCDAPSSWIKYVNDLLTIFIPSHFLPENNGTQDLGGIDNQWNDVYADNFIGNIVPPVPYQENLPIGTILMYNGAALANVSDRVDDIGTEPNDNITLIGWKVANGNAGTPNLTNMFLRGDVVAGNTDGTDAHKHSVDPVAITNYTNSSDTHTHATDIVSFNTGSSGVHLHSYTQVPNHVHVVPIYSGTTDGAWATFDSSSTTPGTVKNINSDNPTGGVATAYTNSSDAHTHTVDPISTTSAVGGAHVHRFVVDTPSTDSSTVSNIPAYYTVIYIIKVA